MIILKPAAEKFILNAAIKANINPNEFELPTNLKPFSDLTKKENILKNNLFRSFLKKIYSQETSFTELKKILKSIHKEYSLPDFWL